MTKRIVVPQKVTLCRVDNLKRERGSQTQQIKTQPTEMIARRPHETTGLI